MKQLKSKISLNEKLFETKKNYFNFSTFNFTVPYLSWIAVGLLAGATFVLYLIPIRYLLMLWGTNKFLRRLLRPHSVPNNEILDLLSRVPDDEMLVCFINLKYISTIKLYFLCTSVSALTQPINIYSYNIALN